MSSNSPSAACASRRAAATARRRWPTSRCSSSARQGAPMAGKLRAPTLQGLHDIFDFSLEPVSEAEVQAGMPQFSKPPEDSVYKPIDMPTDRDVGLQDLPAGFDITEEGVRDPQGKPAKFRSPSVGQMLSKLGTDILPVAGGTLPALAKGAIGAANGVDKLANGFTMGSGPVMPGTLAGLGGLAVLPRIASPTPSDAEQAL